MAGPYVQQKSWFVPEMLFLPQPDHARMLLAVDDKQQRKHNGRAFAEFRYGFVMDLLCYGVCEQKGPKTSPQCLSNRKSLMVNFHAARIRL